MKGLVMIYQKTTEKSRWHGFNTPFSPPNGGQIVINFVPTWTYMPISVVIHYDTAEKI